MNLDKAFNANDIRGVYGKELTDELAYRVARAFVVHFKAKNVVVGRDMRLSSPALAQNFINGVIDQGANVIDIDLVSSDALYFATALLNKPGVMITASHNPAKYNGIKFSLAKAIPINGEKDLSKIRELVKKNKFPKAKKGKIVKKDISREYVKHVHSFVDIKKLKKMKIVVDAGNGMAAKMFPLVSSKLPVELATIGFTLDGSFPIHVANPAKHKNLKHAELKVCMTNSDFGVAFDGDIDRVAFIDEKCKHIDPSLVAALIIKHFAKKRKNSKFVYNSVMSKIIPETAKKYKGKAYREKVGHTYIKRTMRKFKADFGCENSGHFYFKKNYFADSGIISFLIVAEMYSNYNGKFSDMLKEFRKYSKIIETSFKTKDKDRTIAKVEDYYKDKANKVDYLDGVTIYFNDWWFNLRKSNTEPLIRLNLEANTKKLMDQKKREVIKIIRKFS